MRVPIVFVGQRLIDAVIKVLVMRKQDMAAHVVELRAVLVDQFF